VQEKPWDKTIKRYKLQNILLHKEKDQHRTRKTTILQFRHNPLKIEKTITRIIIN